MRPLHELESNLERWSFFEQMLRSIGLPLTEANKETASNASKVVRGLTTHPSDTRFIDLGNLSMHQAPILFFPQRIALPVSDGFKLISPQQVMHCAADANFTWVHMENGEKFMTCRLLKDLEEKMPVGTFLKAHRSYLVNISKVEAIKRSDGWELILSNGQHVPIARDRKDAVMKVFGIGQ